MCSVQLIFSVLRHNYPHFKGFQSCDVLLYQSPCFCTVQGRTSNQSFHHSFLEASSYFSIFPLVIPPGKGFFLIAIQGRQFWGMRVATPIFWAGGSCGVAGRVVGRVAGGSLGSWTGREILLYLIMHRKYVRKWLLLKRNRIIWPEVAVNGHFFAWKSIFFNCLKKSKFSEICLQNLIFFCKIA